MLRTLTILLVTSLLPVVASAQMPTTQLYVFDLRIGDTLITLTNPRYLSQFNAAGYNNQPYWAEDDVLYASVRMPEKTQPDIYRFDLGNGTRQQMTDTEAGEYSPKVQVRGGDRFTAIRQEYVGSDTVLRLWDFPADLSESGRPVFTSLDNIGYYEWLNPSQLALYLTENPSRLVVSAAGDGATPQTLATNTGRSFARLRNGDLVYVDKNFSPYRLMQRNLYRLDENPTAMIELPDGTEDFIVLRDGSLLTGRGSKLYRHFPGGIREWQLVADLNFYGFRDITRMAVSEDGQLAVVAEN